MNQAGGLDHGCVSEFRTVWQNEGFIGHNCFRMASKGAESDKQHDPKP